MAEIRAPDDRVKVKQNLIGMKFGRLTVIDQADDYVGHNGKHYAKWFCECECGNCLSVRQDALKRGGVISCGCWQREFTSTNKKGVPVTHGGTHDRLYGIWVNMRRRCRAQHRRDYKSYGERGIKVCEVWDKDYQSFKNWALLNGYDASAGFGACTLDRIDVNGPYSPENCRWVSMSQQANNKTTSRFYTYQGRTQTIAEWADEYGLSRETLWRRLVRYGLPFETALMTPITRNGRTLKEIIQHGTSIQESAQISG